MTPGQSTPQTNCGSAAAESCDKKKGQFGLHAEIRNINGTPTVVADEIPLPPMWFTGSPVRPGYAQELGTAGIKVFFIRHRLTELECTGSWQELDRKARHIIGEVPDAMLILRTALNASDEWKKAHPEELIQFADGTPMPTWLGEDSIEALCSEQWRRDQSRALVKLVAHIASQDYGKRVIGFFLGAGGTEEWYIPGCVVHEKNQVIDHSPAFRRHHGAVLKAFYHNEKKLQAAWADPTASFADPKIPSAADHYLLSSDSELNTQLAQSGCLPPWPEQKSVIGSLLNPDTHRHVADYYRSINIGTADSIIHFARVLKNATAGTKVIGAFYGSFALPYTGTAAAVTRILDSGVVDFLAAPGNYENRWPGGVVGQREMQDAFRLRNRIFVVEEDTRTCLTGVSNDWGVNSIEHSIETMKRDFGRNLSEDLGAWWFDMGGRWYDHPELKALIQRQQEVARIFYERGNRKPNPEIAFFYDQESLYYMSGETVSDLGLRTRNWEIHRIGAPVACHYTEDMKWDLPAYKLIVMLNPFVLTDAKRQMIQQYLQQNSCSVLWIYAPGIINPDAVGNAFNPHHLEKLCGFSVGCEKVCADTLCRLTDAGARALPGLRQDLDYGWFDRYSVGTIVAQQPQGPAQRSLLAPYLYGNDPDAEVLMRFIADGHPAMLQKARGKNQSTIAFFKALSASLYRELAARAGSHVYLDSDDVFYAGSSFVTIHASSSGEKRIQLPQVASPFEIYEQKSYGEATRTIHCRMRTGQTRTFYLKGKI